MTNTLTNALTDNTIAASFRLAYPGDKADGFSLDVDVTVPGNGITAIFGHSGSGKTTFLRCVAGLETADSGELTVKGDIWQSASHCKPTHKRPLGYVFQESSLFPHLTAKANLDYAIKRSGVPFSQDLYERVLSVMAIAPVLPRYPAQLSGGERQRVAIARALLIQPKLLLMDEPLASLDSARKQEILPYLERLRASFDIPIFYVSHSMDEVAHLADHILVLEQGKLVAQGNLTEVLSRIDLPLKFGEETGVIITGEVAERDNQWHLVRIAFDGGELWVRDGGDALKQSVRVRVLARDVSLALASHDDTSIVNRLAVEVVEISQDQDEAMALVRLKCGAEYFIARLTQKSVHQLQLEPGKHAWAQIKSVAVVR
ncbi:molybdenum ABC transporter ATP-binding protein [Thalassomonas sp. RHCl1]|uniref:molybdenum ABC transporter ATP-binding protein n=1 Tax=Thalassomonas sp. RHCl1 TaxID=2995320 RepID=UPI00248D2190|nr:molybdenum ABC transporter ATP-binding protein [Thalassomonas sp. RHCl1]